MQAKKFYGYAGIVVGGLVATLNTKCVSGGLIESIDYNQGVTLVSPPLTSGVPSQYLSGTTLPVMQTISLSYNGELSQSTYNFSDSSVSAALEIDSVFTLSRPNEHVAESSETQQKTDTNIEFDMPVAYTMTIVNSTNSAIFLGAVDGEIIGFGGTGGALNGTYSTSGILAAGQVYSISEGYGVGNTDVGDSPSGSGYNNFQITFTAIPEPSSLMMIFGCATLLLKRPMRWTKVGLSNA